MKHKGLKTKKSSINSGRTKKCSRRNYDNWSKNSKLILRHKSERQKMNTIRQSNNNRRHMTGRSNSCSKNCTRRMSLLKICWLRDKVKDKWRNYRRKRFLKKLSLGSTHNSLKKMNKLLCLFRSLKIIPRNWQKRWEIRKSK